MNVDFLSI